MKRKSGTNPSHRRQAKKHDDSPANLQDVCRVFESIAPLHLAQSWDHVGLIAGDPSAVVSNVLLCIDLMPAVVDDAIGHNCQLVMAYHPPIFKPITRLRADDRGLESSVFRCISRGIAVYSMHTALDAAEGGTNDVLADLCGVKEILPLEYVPKQHTPSAKLITFVPSKHLEPLAESMFREGAGHIGDYSHCSFRSNGSGTFRGGNSTNPTVGHRGKFEEVEEIRFESIVPIAKLPAVIKALRDNHPYEEPAFDLYPLMAEPIAGIGRVGNLSAPIPLKKLAQKLARATHSTTTQIVGDPAAKIVRVICVAGSAGDIPLKSAMTAGTAIITGEIRHHDALQFLRMDACAVAVGHRASERRALNSVQERVMEKLPGVSVVISEADHEPLQSI